MLYIGRRGHIAYDKYVCVKKLTLLIGRIGQRRWGYHIFRQVFYALKRKYYHENCAKKRKNRTKCTYRRTV